jgi:hypothetical protein
MSIPVHTKPRYSTPNGSQLGSRRRAGQPLCRRDGVVPCQRISQSRTKTPLERPLRDELPNDPRDHGGVGLLGQNGHARPARGSEPRGSQRQRVGLLHSIQEGSRSPPAGGLERRSRRTGRVGRPSGARPCTPRRGWGRWPGTPATAHSSARHRPHPRFMSRIPTNIVAIRASSSPAATASSISSIEPAG